MKSYRKKHRLLPVSFFAFQDIITALAGCMLIFVLTLAAGNRGGSAENPGRSYGRKDHDLLLGRIRLTRSSLAAEEKKAALLQQQLESGAVSEQNKHLNRQLATSSSALEKSIRQRSQMLESMQKELSLLKKQNRQLMDDNPELAGLVTQASVLEKQYRDQQKKLVFANDSNRKNIVLTLSRNSWLLQTGAAAPAGFLGSGVDALPRLKETLRTFDPARLRLIIAVRPSAGGFAEILKNDLKKSFPAMETVAEPLTDEMLGGVKL